VDAVFPPTGRPFAMSQSHWFLMGDGRIIEHWANRDDLGMARQLGWIPPTPAYLFKMARAKRRARRRGLGCPAGYSSGVSQSTPIGGTVMMAEAGRPW
jgi:hypothetical protein